jgi:hypothetical protein
VSCSDVDFSAADDAAAEVAREMRVRGLVAGEPR